MLAPYFRYYGAKSSTAWRYPAPQYDTVREPFAGTATYSLLYPHKKVVLYDKYPVVAGIWDYIIKASEREVMDLPDVVHHEDINDFRIPQEAKWLIGMWLDLTPLKPRTKAKQWTKDYFDNGRHGYEPGRLWGKRVRCRIAHQLKYTRHWKVYCKSYEEVGDFRCTWFVDPPYNNKAGRCYVESSKNIDYDDLGDWCGMRRGQVIVCENEGANWLPFEPLFRVRAAPNKTRDKTTVFSHEVMYYHSDRSTGLGLMPRSIS